MEEYQRLERTRKSDIQPLFIKYWPVVALSFSLISGGAVLHADVRTQGDDIKTIKEEIKSGSVLIAEHKTVIPIIQQDIKELKEIVKTMSDKQDRQYESIMKAVKQ